jgi:GGDEF-like domain
VLDTLRPPPLAEEMADLLMASIPELGRAADQDLSTGLLLSCEGNLAAIWGHLLASASLDAVTPPPEAIAWSHELVHRGVPLPALLRAYRLGHGLAERRLEEVAAGLETEPEIRWRVLARISHYLFAYIDAVCTDLVDDYEQERAQWIRGAAAARAELVGAIVERQPVDAHAATEKLRYDVSRRHLALILWGDPPRAGQRSSSLEREVTALAEALGGGPVLTVPIGERVVWAWTSGDDLSDDPRTSGHGMGDGVRAAVGTCRAGLAGMADSHDEARVARRVGELRALRGGTIVGYRAADRAPDRGSR